MERPRSVKCENCLFYDQNVCKRYPPQLVNQSSNIDTTHTDNGSKAYGMYSPTSVWPQVWHRDFCGEFMPKDNLMAIEWVAWKKGLLEAGQSQ